jgi:LmbE family N-acetylglucosaminyl deacetylase
MKKILVIAAHPDDEILGAGGTISKHVKNQDEVYCLILGLGVESRLDKKSVEKNEGSEKEIERMQESLNCAKILGIKEIFFEDFPDNRFDGVDLLDITKKVEDYVKLVKPEIIYTHYENDLNVDHRRVFQAVITACRPCNENCPKEIYSFEVLSGTEWQLEGAKFFPNVYIDIEENIEIKLRALDEYKSEIRDYPHPRSKEGIEILSKYRGLECGKRYAEAFKLVRIIK